MASTKRVGRRVVVIDDVVVTPGEKVYRWWDAGISVEPQVLTVVRINPTTVTVKTEQGNTFRMSADDIVGRWTED